VQSAVQSVAFGGQVIEQRLDDYGSELCKVVIILVTGHYSVVAIY
jgi:hypothetical protein